MSATSSVPRRRRLRRRHVRLMTPAAVEFLQLYLAGWSVRALARRFDMHPVDVVTTKKNFWHEHRISSINPFFIHLTSFMLYAWYAFINSFSKYFCCSMCP